MNPIVYAIPLFLLLIAVELVATAVRKKHYYRLNDSINSLSCGLLNISTGLIIKIGGYAFVFEHFALTELSSGSWWVWLLAFVIQDFLYYWVHRTGHVVNLFWAAHAVHHQSEEYNLTTALRQTSSGVFLSWIFYLPMAVIGFPVEMFATVSLLNLLYQFWVHTRHIGYMGWYEKIFVTPSSHRVHHAKNARYLDKNFGGIFILWDRLFGSFQAELTESEPEYEPIRYGTVKPLRSWNPLWANLVVYVDTFRIALQTRSWGDRLALWFYGPGYRPAGMGEADSAADGDQQKSYNPPMSSGLKIYVLMQFALLVLATVALVAVSHMLAAELVLLWTTVLAIQLWGVNALMERPGKVMFLEGCRLVTVLAGLGLFFLMS